MIAHNPSDYWQFANKSLLVSTLICCVLGATLLKSARGEDYTSHWDLQYSENPGFEPRLTSLDIHVPQDVQGAPILFYIHGGSWAFGDKHLGNSPKLSFFTELGFIVVSSNYRLSTKDIKHPIHVNDVADAVRWVHENIDEYCGNPNAIYLMGHSAGAHLASLLVLDESKLERAGGADTTIQGVIMVDSAAYDMVRMMEELQDTPSSYFHVAFGSDRKTWIDASPQHHIKPRDRFPGFLVLMASPVRMPMSGQLKRAHSAKWEEVSDFVSRLRDAEASVYTVDAMKLASHRSINRDIGVKGDRISEVIANFLRMHEAKRKGEEHLMSVARHTSFSVSIDEWKRVSQELGDYATDVFFRFRDTNGDGRLERNELQEHELDHFETWDLDKDGGITRKDIVRGYQALDPP